MREPRENSKATSAEFKQAMRHLARGVTIIATEHEGRRTGLAATVVCSVSADPPTVLICINSGATAHEPIRQSGRFSVNLLASGQDAIARCFSGEMGIKGEERFAVGTWTPLVTGAPVLESALASRDCRVTEVVEMATHSVFFWGCGRGYRRGGCASLDLRPWGLRDLLTGRGRIVVVKADLIQRLGNIKFPLILTKALLFWIRSNTDGAHEKP